MKYIRAAEAGAMGEIPLCIEWYPCLAGLVGNPYEVGGNLAQRLLPIKDHAIELARAQALEQLGLAKEGTKDGDPVRAEQAKKKYGRLLYRLAPGRGGSLKAILLPSGVHATDPEEMAAALRAH